MSTEKSVRVRVKVYDNTTSIYSQDIEITNGEGTFIVPAIMADSDVIALQVTLFSLNHCSSSTHVLHVMTHFYLFYITSVNRKKKRINASNANVEHTVRKTRYDRRYVFACFCFSNGGTCLLADLAD